MSCIEFVCFCSFCFVFFHVSLIILILSLAPDYLRSSIATKILFSTSAIISAIFSIISMTVLIRRTQSSRHRLQLILSLHELLSLCSAQRPPLIVLDISVEHFTSLVEWNTSVELFPRRNSSDYQCNLSPTSVLALIRSTNAIQTTGNSTKLSNTNRV